MTSPIHINDRVFVPAEAIEIAAVRASGPGGQNVNKVSSKVDVRIDIDKIVGLSDQARARLFLIATSLLDSSGRLHLTSQRTRDQLRNIEDVYDKVRTLIERALIVPVQRKPTKPTKSSVRARLSDKKHNATRKTQRKRTLREE